MSKTDGSAVSERIRRAIRRSRRTQTGVATTCGLSWPQWQRRMSGDVGWRLDEVQRVADHLGLPLTDLTEGGEG